MAILALPDASGLDMILLWRFAVLVSAALVLAGRPALSGVRTGSQFALAAAPFLVTGYFAGVVGEETVLPWLVLLAVTGLAVRRWRRRSPGRAGRV
ncbi:hypothetical protein PV721_25325 [Streptomyces sp. MB09-01]|uniref:hypothetical protein n=1 Tax=Streptomyces sp. MB09-01 TaxID=3028666 RepID=UPI0029A0604F|nr:hypothetical protein [Streptomyces sp. MB09-01]MDX3537631.1 hypothetical protein [Streptomyces sp. MB09-01]